MLIVQGDTGFGQMGCYGSPIDTPNIDGLAANGLLLNNMHGTGLAGPTHYCILTGRNQVMNAASSAVGRSTASGGHSNDLSFENGMLSEILAAQGYRTYASGRWLLAPGGPSITADSPRHGPVQRGFEHFYGTYREDPDQYYPDLIRDSQHIDVTKSGKVGYHLTEDLVDEAIKFIVGSSQPGSVTPFFVYLSPGAAGDPHQVPKEWADRYAGRFDDGWVAYRENVFQRQKELGVVPKDAELSRRDPDVPDWENLSASERKLYARMMEVFAGVLSHADYHYGRLFQCLKELGQWDNTIVVFVSDNGASPEGGVSGSVNEMRFINRFPERLEQNLARIDELGGPLTFNHYPWGWAWAGNTPFRRWKGEAYRGGISVPCVVQWLGGIKARGERRTQYAHVVDIMPTILDLLAIDAPAAIGGTPQSLINGCSLANGLAKAESSGERHIQAFQVRGHRSIHRDGWNAVCPWPGASFSEAEAPFGLPVDRYRLTRLDQTAWELYHVTHDVAENHNLAGEKRALLTEMIAAWYAEEAKTVASLRDSSRLSPALEAETASICALSPCQAYYPGPQRVPAHLCPSLLNRSYRITADVEIPGKGAQGVLLAAGDGRGGFSLFLLGGRVNYVYNYLGNDLYHIKSDVVVAPGRHLLRFEFETTGAPDISKGCGAPGVGKIYIDDDLAAIGEIPRTMPLALGLRGGLICGSSAGSPIVGEYEPPFRFTGKLTSVTVTVDAAEPMEGKAVPAKLIPLPGPAELT